MEGLIFGGAYLRREICVSKSIGLALYLEVNLPFLLCFTLYFEGNFPSTSPRVAYIWRGDLTEGFLRYRFGGLIFGGAYTWRGLFSEFYSISMLPTPSLEKVSSYGLLPRFIYISPGRVQKRYFEPFFSIHVIHVITNLGIG